VSFKASAWAVEQRVGDPIAKLLLLTLAEAAGIENQSCYPSNKTLADRIEASEDTVTRKMKVLVDGGFIRVERRNRPDGSRTSNLYIVNVDHPKPQPAATPPHSCAATPPHSCAGAVTGQEQVNEPTCASKDQKEPEGFTEFWKSYPKKTAKPAAIRSFRAIKPDLTTRTAILADIERRRNSEEWQKNGGQFIPLPSSYLNQRRWEDQGVDFGGPPEAATGSPARRNAQDGLIPLNEVYRR